MPETGMKLMISQIKYGIPTTKNGVWLGVVAKVIDYDEIPAQIAEKLSRRDLKRTILVVNLLEEGRKYGEKYLVLRDGTEIKDMLKWSEGEWKRFIKELLVKYHGEGKYTVTRISGGIDTYFSGWVK